MGRALITLMIDIDCLMENGMDWALVLKGWVLFSVFVNTWEDAVNTGGSSVNTGLEFCEHWGVFTELLLFCMPFP